MDQKRSLRPIGKVTVIRSLMTGKNDSAHTDRYPRSRHARNKKTTGNVFFFNLCGIKRYIVTEQLALVIH